MTEHHDLMSARPTPQAMEVALSALNLWKLDLAQTVKAVVLAAPGGISKWEWISLSFQGLAVGKDLLLAVTDLTPEAQRAMLYVLEHMTFTLPPPA